MPSGGSGAKGRVASRKREGKMNHFIVELPADLKAEVSRRASQQPGGESAARKGGHYQATAGTRRKPHRQKRAR